MIRPVIGELTPAIVYIEATLRCNLRCGHCYVERAKTPPSEELTIAQWCGVLDELVTLGSLVAVVTGGELFTRADVFDLLGEIRKRHFALVVFTNGTLIGPAEADALYRLAPIGVEISIHGHDAPSHDAIVGVASSFERSIEAVRLLTARKVRVKLKHNVLSVNESHHDAFIALAKDLGVEWTVDPYIFLRRDGDRTPQLMRATQKGMTGVLSDPRVRRCGKPHGAPVALQVPQAWLCGAGRTVIRIAADGGVYPCVALPFSAGSVKNEPLSRIWRESGSFARMRSLTNGDLDECGTCDLARYCGRCTAMAFQETGSLTACSPTSKNIAQIRRTLHTESAETVPVAEGCPYGT